MTIATSLRLTALTAAVVAATTLLSGCPAVLLGGAMVGGTMFAADRRSSGAQIDDQSIELKASNRAHEVLGSDRGHVNATSYNRLLLLTGEVPSEADKAAIEQTAAKIDNVRTVVNELAVMTSSSLTNRSNDTLITSKVKATLVDAGDISASAFKVVTERGIVYLMGRVTEREATRASNLIRTISGVQKVIRAVEIITEAELAELQPNKAPKFPPPSAPAAAEPAASAP